jgi:hypothetical protein
MIMHINSSPTWKRRDAGTLRERIQPLLELELFRQALAEVQRYQGWQTDPESLQQFGRIMHRFAPRSKDRSCTYSFARALYRTAATYSDDPVLDAELQSDVGRAYFEEGRLDDAVDAFEASRSSAPWRFHAHLGLLAIACARRDAAAIRQRCKGLVAAVPGWHANRETVALLVNDPDFAFLRASPALFLQCLGGYPEHLCALHDRYCLEALDGALASFGTQELQDALELTRVVGRTFDSVKPILRRHSCTLLGVSPTSLQARIGF